MTINEIQDQIIEEFAQFGDWMERYEYLIDLADRCHLSMRGTKPRNTSSRDARARYGSSLPSKTELSHSPLRAMR
jgi:hypothetical protein